MEEYLDGVVENWWGAVRTTVMSTCLSRYSPHTNNREVNGNAGRFWNCFVFFLLLHAEF